MEVDGVDCDIAEEFIRRQPVTLLLYYSPQDLGAHELHWQLSQVARSFDDLFAFGALDLTAKRNRELIEKAIIPFSPILIFYWYGEPTLEYEGRGSILRVLDQNVVVRTFGSLFSGAKLWHNANRRWSAMCSCLG